MFNKPFEDGYLGIDRRLDAIDKLPEAEANIYIHLWGCGEAEAYNDEQEQTYYDEQNYWFERNGGM